MTRELAVQFPHEMCILHRSIILLFGMPTCALVSHNAYMLPHLWRRGHSALFLWCLLRVSLCVVRPYLWWHVLRVYREARLQPTPALVAQAFISAQVRSPAIRWNARLGMAYIFWLGVTSVTLFARGALWGGRDEVQEVLWNHCKLNFWSLLVQVRRARRLARSRPRAAAAARADPALPAPARAEGDLHPDLLRAHLVR